MISLLSYYKYLRKKKYILQLKKPGVLREMVDSWNEARKVRLEDLVVIKCKKELENKKIRKGQGEGGMERRKGEREKGKEGKGKGSMRHSKKHKSQPKKVSNGLRKT